MVAPEINVLNIDQVRTLIAAVANTDDAVLYNLELPRGIRRASCSACAGPMSTSEKAELHIRKQAQNGKLFDLKDAASQRILSLTPSEVTCCTPSTALPGTATQGRGQLAATVRHGVPDQTGRPRRNSNQHKAWKRLLKRAGLPVSTTFHDLRHTAATVSALADGMPMFDVSRMLGHASFATTADRYGAWTDSGRRATAEHMERIFRPA